MSAPRNGGGMRAPGSSFSVTCWPGRRSTAFVQEVRPGEFALVIQFDPVDTVVTQAPFPTGAADFVRWCRELSRAAGQIATRVEIAADLRRPRHYIDEPTEQGGGEQQ